MEHNYLVFVFLARIKSSNLTKRRDNALAQRAEKRLPKLFFRCDTCIGHKSVRWRDDIGAEKCS